MDCVRPRTGWPEDLSLQGRVTLTKGDLDPLVGSHVEVASKIDPAVRASGVIQPDGTFVLETLHGGVILSGAQEGSYQARLVLSDDGDRRAQRQSRAAVHPRFLQFKTSGLTLAVPTQRDVTFTLSPR